MLVIADRFSKYDTFLLAHKNCSAEETSHLFFKHVVRLWDILEDIVSNWDD